MLGFSFTVPNRTQVLYKLHTYLLSVCPLQTMKRGPQGLRDHVWVVPAPSPLPCSRLPSQSLERTDPSEEMFLHRCEVKGRPTDVVAAPFLRTSFSFDSLSSSFWGRTVTHPPGSSSPLQLPSSRPTPSLPSACSFPMHLLLPQLSYSLNFQPPLPV